MSCSLSEQDGTTFTYTFTTIAPNANYGISVQHDSIPEEGLPMHNGDIAYQKDSNLTAYINSKTMNGFELHFGFGDNGEKTDVPFAVNHSVMVYGLGGAGNSLLPDYSTISNKVLKVNDDNNLEWSEELLVKNFEVIETSYHHTNGDFITYNFNLDSDGQAQMPYVQAGTAPSSVPGFIVWRRSRLNVGHLRLTI